MNVLILGGTGLISAAISRQLQERGVEVTLFTRGQRAPALPPLRKPPEIIGDRYDAASFEAQLRQAQPFDAVIDMIGYTPADAESLVRACAGRAKHVIYCSSVDAIAKPSHRYPVGEDPARRGNNAYGRNKVISEDILLAAHARGDFAVTIIRPAHSYGEGQTISGVLGPRGHLDRIRKGKPIIVHGDGSSLWSACHVEDVGQAFVGAIGNTAAFGKAYAVAGDEWFTWDEWMRTAAEIMGAPSPRLVHIPSDLLGRIAPRRSAIVVENLSGNNVFDCSAAKRDLGFRYTISLRAGMERTIRYAEAHGLIDSCEDDPLYEELLASWERVGEELAATLGGLDSPSGLECQRT